MQYGQWGHDLPYMLNYYNKAAYIWWINSLLATVKLEDGRQNRAMKGIRKQVF